MPQGVARRRAARIASLLLTAAAATLWLAASPGASRADEPIGVVSLDASAGDNDADSVGPIGGVGAVTDTCNAGAGISTDLVIGNPDGSGGIPEGKDIAGWQARIVFDANILAFKGFQVTDNGQAGAGFLMEKASDHDEFTNDHIKVQDPQSAPGTGAYNIGSTILRTPSGARGEGLLARLVFDCVSDGPVSIDIADAGDSFYADINAENHTYALRRGVLLAVNVEEELLGTRTPTEATPVTATPAGEAHSEESPGAEPGVEGEGDGVGGGEDSGEGEDGAVGGADGGDDWVVPAIAVAAAAVLLAAGGACWLYLRRR